MAGQLAEDGMDKAATDRIGQQVRLAFPDGAITRVQVLQYGDDPEVEPGQAAVRAFFDWPGRAEGGQADPKTVYRFVTTNAAALGALGDGLPRVIGWAEFRPEGRPGRPALVACPTGSPTAGGRPPHAMNRQKSAHRLWSGSGPLTWRPWTP